MEHQNAWASPPYRFGSSFASIMGNKALLTAWCPVPTTVIFSRFFAAIIGLKAQNIQLRRVGTFMNSFLFCEAYTRLVHAVDCIYDTTDQ